MPARPGTIAMGAAASMVLTLLLATLGAGCGPGAAEVDKAALYTPESLASEFAYRFRQLDPDARTAAVRYKRSREGQKDAERLARVDQAKNKTSGGAPAKKKQAGPRTLDDLLADIDGKLDLIKGVSRADACRKMAETISRDTSISEDDRKRLTDLVGQLDGSH
jgi:hypothetical protein